MTKTNIHFSKLPKLSIPLFLLLIFTMFKLELWHQNLKIVPEKIIKLSNSAKFAITVDRKHFLSCCLGPKSTKQHFLCIFSIFLVYPLLNVSIVIYDTFWFRKSISRVKIFIHSQDINESRGREYMFLLGK